MRNTKNKRPVNPPVLTIVTKRRMEGWARYFRFPKMDFTEIFMQFLGKKWSNSALAPSLGNPGSANVISYLALNHSTNKTQVTDKIFTLIRIRALVIYQICWISRIQ